MRTNLRIDETTEGDITTLAVSGELDEGSCGRLADCLAGHCRPGARIVLDLRPLNFMDGAGLEPLLQAVDERRLRLDQLLARPREREPLRTVDLRELLPPPRARRPLHREGVRA